MKKLLTTLALGTGLLFSVSGYAAVQSCEAKKPANSSGDWSGYCSCFIDQAVAACKSCPAVHAVCTTAWMAKGLHHTTDVAGNCSTQISADSNNNCVAPGTSQDMCVSAMNDYQAHCA